jgi:hypothetical protein
MRAFFWLSGALLSLVPASVYAQDVEPAAPPPEWVIQGQVPEGMALIYLYNNSGPTLFGGSYSFKVDKGTVAKLPRKTWTAIVLAPGTYRIAVQDLIKAPLETGAGERLHWMYRFSPEKSWAFPLAGTPYVLQAIPDSVAAELRGEFTWVPPLVPLPEPPPRDSVVSPSDAGTH